MGRTSIKNKLILSFMWLLLIVLTGVGVVNRLTDDFLVAQAVSVGLAMAAGVIFGGMFSRSIVGRLNALRDVAHEISRGDLSKQIPVVSQDEVRDLEEIFGVMVNHLRTMLSEIRKSSVRIQETNLQLNGLVDKVLAGSREIDRAAQDIAKGTEQQTLIVQQTSLRMDHGLKAMDDMAKNTADTVAKINEARVKTEMGETGARETLKHLEGVLEQMEQHAEPIYRLAHKIEKIKMVIRVLDEVAQKTDLLSLNASIEAARASELGKGFGMVASEIRMMAENSKQSSQTIGKMVEDLLEDNKAVLDALRKSQEGIQKGRGIIHGIVNTFGEMLSGVKAIFSEVQKVEEVSRKQVEQMGEMLVHFQELTQLARENFLATQKATVATRHQGEDMEKIMDAMRSLNALSEKMMEIQDRFRISLR